MLAILAFERLRQEEPELEVSLGYTVRTCFKKATKQQQPSLLESANDGPVIHHNTFLKLFSLSQGVMGVMSRYDNINYPKIL